MKKYVAVLDFITGEVFIYSYSPKVLKNKFDDDIESFIQSKSHSVSNCQYMCMDEIKVTVK